MHDRVLKRTPPPHVAVHAEYAEKKLHPPSTLVPGEGADVAGGRVVVRGTDGAVAGLCPMISGGQ